MNLVTAAILKKALVGVSAAALLGGGAVAASGSAFAATSPSPSPNASAPAKGDVKQDRRQIRRAILTSEAHVLGMSVGQLRHDLRSGQKVSDLAAAQGMSKDQFIDKLVADLKPALDKLVDTHAITQKQEDRVLARIKAGWVPAWNGIRHPKDSSSSTTTH